MPVIPALCRGEALAIWEVQGQPGIEEIKEEKEKGFSINLSMGIEERESPEKEGAYILSSRQQSHLKSEQ